MQLECDEGQCDNEKWFICASGTKYFLGRLFWLGLKIPTNFPLMLMDTNSFNPSSSDVCSKILIDLYWISDSTKNCLHVQNFVHCSIFQFFETFVHD